MAQQKFLEAAQYNNWSTGIVHERAWTLPIDIATGPCGEEGPWEVSIVHSRNIYLSPQKRALLRTGLLTVTAIRPDAIVDPLVLVRHFPAPKEIFVSPGDASPEDLAAQEAAYMPAEDAYVQAKCSWRSRLPGNFQLSNVVRLPWFEEYRQDIARLPVDIDEGTICMQWLTQICASYNMK